MAVTNDYVIRLIVKGEDFASQVTNRVARNIGKDGKSIQKTSREIRAELDLVAQSLANLDVVLKSKATTQRGMARILGVTPKEVTDEFQDLIAKLRRIASGEITTRKQKADLFGISEKDVAALEDRIERTLALAERVNQKGFGTKGSVALRTQSLLGVPLADQDIERKVKRTLEKTGKTVIVPVTQHIKGLRSEIIELNDEIQKTERLFKSLGQLAEEIDTGKISDLTRIGDFRTGIISADRDALKERLARQVTDDAFFGREGFGAAANLARFQEDEINRLRESLDLQKQQTDEVNKRLGMLRDIKAVEDIENLRKRFEITPPPERLAIARFSQSTIEDFRRGRVNIGPDDRVSLAAEGFNPKIQAALNSFEKLIGTDSIQKIKLALLHLDKLASEFRKSADFEKEYNKQLNETIDGMGQFNKSIGSFVRGFFQLETFMKQRQIDFEKSRLRDRRELAIEERKILAQQLDLRVEDKDIGRLRPPRTEEEFKQFELKTKDVDLLRLNREVGKLDRQIIVLDRDANSLGNTFFRAGGRIRYFVNQANQLVNARWLFLITLWTSFITVLIQMGIAIVEVGSSAVKAGAALAGAFTAGVLQALSAITLLRAAFSRIGKVFELAAQQDEQRIRASTDAEAQAKAEADAQKALTEALEEQQDAIGDLAKARKEAARAIVDANLKEKEANLSLREAELALIEAKEDLIKLENKQMQDASSLDFLQGQVTEAQRRLALAQELGQEAEISAASHQLTIAQQNLNAFLDQAENKTTELKRAQIDAEQAAINLRQARIAAKRAREDNAELKAKGVEGSDQVVAALERVENATDGVADAQERLAEASVKQTAAQQQLQDQLADLSQAERGLFNTIVKLREEFRNKFRPITDIIVRSVDDGIQRASDLLRDKRITGAATSLAVEIGHSIDKLSEFVVSDEVRKSLAFFTLEAKKNLPLVTDALINIATAFLRIGRAASPILRNLLERFTGLTERFEKWTRNSKNLESFFASASRHLNSWIQLSKAIIGLLFVIGGSAAPSGQTFIDNITQKLIRWRKELEENREGLDKFFEDQRKNLEDFVDLLIPLGKAIFETFTSPGAEAFVKLIAEVLVPALGQAVVFLGIMSSVLLAISRIPLAKEIIAFAFAWGILTRVVPVLRNIDKLLVSIIGWAAKKGFFKTAWDVAIASVLRFSKVLKGEAIGTLVLYERVAKAAAFAQGLLNKAILLNPYVRVAAFVVVLVAALIKLETEYQAVSKFAKDFVDDVQAILDFFEKINSFEFHLFENIFDDLFNSIEEKAREFWNDLPTALRAVITFAAKGIGFVFGDDLKEESVNSVEGLGFTINSALGGEFAQVEREIQKQSNKLVASLGGLQGLIEEQLSQALFEPTPASLEAEKIRKQEAARDRQAAVQDAVDTSKQLKNERNKAAREVTRAEKALKNASTAEEKKAARERLTIAKQNYKQIEEQLKDAVKRENEIKHDAAVEARLDYLDELDKEQREAIQKRVKSAIAQANVMFNSLKKAIKDKKWEEVQRIFNNIVKLTGANSIEELGRKSADALVAGLLSGLKTAQGRINKAVTGTQEKALLEAKRNRRASKILDATSVDEGLALPGATPSGKLNYILSTGQVDMKMVAAILKATSPKFDRIILDKVFELLGIDLKVKDVLKGRSPENYLLTFLGNHPNQQKALKAFADAVLELQIFDVGGQVRGSQGQPVPIIAHAGEWVVNKEQQSKLARRLGTTAEELKMFLFGSRMDAEAYAQVTAGLKSSTEKSRRYETFQLVPKEDNYGQTVWFVEMDDGFYAQVRKKDASRIIATGGEWVPGYIKRNRHGFTASYMEAYSTLYGSKKHGSRAVKAMARGGEVLSSFAIRGFNPVISAGIQTFADGGIVTASPDGVNNSSVVTKTINQNFNVRTEGETDWNYVMRLGAINSLG